MIQNLLGYSLDIFVKLSDIFEYLSLYSIKLYIRFTISISLAISISVLFISVLQLIKGAQSLNITTLFLSSACLAANNCAAVVGAAGSGSAPPSPVINILPLTSIYGSL